MPVETILVIDCFALIDFGPSSGQMGMHEPGNALFKCKGSLAHHIHVPGLKILEELVLFPFAVRMRRT